MADLIQQHFGLILFLLFQSTLFLLWFRMQTRAIKAYTALAEEIKRNTYLMEVIKEHDEREVQNAS